MLIGLLKMSTVSERLQSLSIAFSQLKILATVLVIEYGNFEPAINPDIYVPGGWQPGRVPRRYFYNITSVGTKMNSLGPGCVVGGSSAVNSMGFMRGTSDDYDRWGALGGGSDWDWKGILPYFRKVGFASHLKVEY